MGKQSAQPPAAADPWESSAAQSYWNTFNQVTPFGSLTFSGGGQPTGGGLPPGMTPAQANRAGIRDTRGGTMYGDQMAPMVMPETRTATLELSPELQAQFDMQNQITQNTLQQALQRQADFDASPLNFEGLPAYQYGMDFSGMPTGPNLQGQIPGQQLQQNLGLSGLPGLQSPYQAQGGPQAYQAQGALAPTIDPSALPALDTNFDEATKRVSDAIFQRGQMYLEPVMERQQERLEQRLADQGLTIGNEAYSRDFGDFRDTRNRAYTDLSLQATLAAPQEQARLFGQSLAARQQGFGEQQGLFGQQMAGRQLGMAEQGQQFGQEMAGRQFGLAESDLGFGQSLAARQRLAEEALMQGQFGNQAAMQQFGMDAAGAEFANQAALQGYGIDQQQYQQQLQNQMIANELQNAARAQGFNERGAVRGAQFNELASLLGLQQTNPSQVGMGSFFTPGGVDFMGSQGQQQAAQQAAYQGAINANNAQTGALGSIAGALLMGGMGPGSILGGLFGGGGG